MLTRRTNGASLTLFTSAMFSTGNVAYRYGHGDALAIAGSRAAVGALLLSPLVIRISRDGRLRRLVEDRWAVGAVASSAVCMVIGTLMLRSLTGPQAGLVIATLPAVLVGFEGLISRRRRVPLLALGISVSAAVIASTSGGLAELTPTRLTLMIAFLLVSAIELLFIERALRRHDSWTLLGVTMPLAALMAYGALPLTTSQPTLGDSALVAALIIGVAGTLGRWSRGLLIDRVGATVSSSTAQVTALLTAVGGIVLLNDSIDTIGGVASVIAAGFAFVTVAQASRQEEKEIDVTDPKTGTKDESEGLSVP